MMDSYEEYIREHIEAVGQVWCDLNMYMAQYDLVLEESPLKRINENTLRIDRLIEFHDRSKYRSLEFEGYRQWFYPVDGEEKSLDKFQIAWNHHQKNCSHHWQYWLMWDTGKTIALDMPFGYIVEMLCDWTAMSYKFKDMPSEFYSKQKSENKILLSESTNKSVMELLPTFDLLVEKRFSKESK